MIAAARLLILLLLATVVSADERNDERAAMLDDIGSMARFAGYPAGFSDPVMAAMGTVLRHELVPESQVLFAYENRPLPIGYGQTISQPYIVALMTELIEPDADDVVLEVGTGSGYQAAVLAEIVEQVYSIEIIAALADRAQADHERLGYTNITGRLGDGYFGWEEHAPFDAIVVTAAASHVPPPLIAQLGPGGRMVIPVGGQFMTQQLLLIEKTMDGEVISRQVAAVRFVPLTGDH